MMESILKTDECDCHGVGCEKCTCEDCGRYLAIGEDQKCEDCIEMEDC